MHVKNISSLEAYDLLSNDLSSILVDVRTSSEWEKGVADISNEIILLSSHLLPDMELNPNFETQLWDVNDHKKASLFFICRSGNRSNEAANLIARNWNWQCFNINDGYEGSQYGLGWKKNKLPWQTL